jgi:glutamate/tyrosine decarboxylase-like PLP-dependent enzyme
MPQAKRFPEKGRSRADIMASLKAFHATGADWRSGRVPIFIFHADDELEAVSQDAFDLFFSDNAQGVAALPAIEEMLDDIVGAALSLFNAPPDGDGIMTSGGTESIFLAVQCARDHARAIGRGDPARHKIVLPSSAHPAFDKAAGYLDLDVVRVPIRGDVTADPDAIAAAVDDDTVMIVGSAPSFPHGVFDSIGELGELAERTDTWLHVDACVGGYLAPFVRRLGYGVPAFDFSVPGVTSISADLHKFGYTAKPASTILFRSKALARHAEFRFDAWPRGLYRSRTFLGSRPAGAIASAWAVLHHLGAEGYMRHAKAVMTTRDRLIEGIRSIPGLAIQGAPTLGLFSYGSDEFDIHAVGDGLADRDWFVPRNANPPGIQFLTMPVHAAAVETYLADLAAAVTEARGQRKARDADVIY